MTTPGPVRSRTTSLRFAAAFKDPKRVAAGIKAAATRLGRIAAKPVAPPDPVRRDAAVRAAEKRRGRPIRHHRPVAPTRAEGQRRLEKQALAHMRAATLKVIPEGSTYDPLAAAAGRLARVCALTGDSFQAIADRLQLSSPQRRLLLGLDRETIAPAQERLRLFVRPEMATVPVENDPLAIELDQAKKESSDASQ